MNRQLIYAHIEVSVVERRPEMLFETLIVAERYSKLTHHADCRDIFSSSSPVDEQILTDLADNISSFMSTARLEIVQRQKGNITPKLHLLEGMLYLRGAATE